MWNGVYDNSELICTACCLCPSLDNQSVYHTPHNCPVTSSATQPTSFFKSSPHSVWLLISLQIFVSDGGEILEVLYQRKKIKFFPSFQSKKKKKKRQIILAMTLAHLNSQLVFQLHGSPPFLWQFFHWYLGQAMCAPPPTQHIPTTSGPSLMF